MNAAETQDWAGVPLAVENNHKPSHPVADFGFALASNR